MYASTAVCMRKYNSARAATATRAKHILKCTSLVSDIRVAHMVKQHLTVPPLAKCCISEEELHTTNGATLIVHTAKGEQLYCLHKRFVKDVYTLFILAHFDDHIIQHYNLWCNQQKSIIPGDIGEETIDKYIQYNNKSNLKAISIQL